MRKDEVRPNELFDRHGMPTREALGVRLKRAGQQRALKSSGPDWGEQISAAFRRWAANRVGADICIEDFREQVPASLYPATHKGWGALPRVLVAARLIAPRVDSEGNAIYRPARSQRTHAHPVRIWRVL
jgi:hypothetical protein